MLSHPPAPSRSLSHLQAPAVPLVSGRPMAIPVGWTAAASRWLTALFLLVVLEALYTVPKNMWDLAVGGHEGIGILLGLLFAAAGPGSSGPSATGWPPGCRASGIASRPSPSGAGYSW